MDDKDTFTHRITSAAHTGISKPAGAVISAFDAAAAAKSRGRSRAPFDASQLQIEQGIPLPASATGQKSQYDQVLARMQVGDSVLIARRNAASMASCSRDLGFKVATRYVDDQTSRVWVVALPQAKQTQRAEPPQPARRTKK